MIEELHEIFHPSSQRNPYRTEPIRWRNFTIFMLLLHLGLRAGELLGPTAGAIKSEFSHATRALSDLMASSGSGEKGSKSEV